MRNDKPIVFHGFSDGEDKESDIYIHESVARLPKGIPNPKSRPCVRLPWELSLELTVFPYGDFNEETIANLFVKGGMSLGLGTYRGEFGLFEVTKWESAEK